MICKSCGTDGGETTGLLDNGILLCGTCGAEFETPIKKGQTREFKQDHVFREVGLYIDAGTWFTVGKIGATYTEVSSQYCCLKELPNIYILSKTRVVNERAQI